MRISRALGVVAFLSLLMAPSFSMAAIKSCTCKDESCHNSYKMDCCAKSSDGSGISQFCGCVIQVIPLSSLWLPDPCSPFYSKSFSRQYPGQNTAASNACEANAFSITPYANHKNIGQSSADPPDMDTVEYLPPSAKRVFHVLASDGPLTQKDLIDKTDLPPRTIRYAISRLKGEDMIKEQFCFQDARQSLYSLNGINPK